jgi:23S rRNA (cytosine1962-C5)-methyltransferase
MNKPGGKPKFSSKARPAQPGAAPKKRKPKPFSTARPREEGGPAAARPTQKVVTKAPREGKAHAGVTVTLARGKSKPFWVGHPWVFSGAIGAVSGEVGAGAPCVVEDERNNALGTGYYSPEGQIAVRLLWHRRSTDLPFEPPSFEALLDARINQAIALRVQLGLPSERTTVYRLVNAEGDFLPGLIVDRLDDVTSIQIGSRQMLENRDTIVGLLRKKLPTSRVVISVTETASRLEGIPVTLDHEPPLEKVGRTRPSVEVREDGLRYRVDLESIQKTGFYADQRENRARFASYCAQRTVLDAYCHHGGFGLQAARAGATHVTQVDTSGPAIEGARAAAELNGLAHKVEGLVADAIVYLKESQAAGKTWDRIVIDPPKLAQGRSHLEDALQKYARLNTLAMATLSPGGLLLTNSCSRHVSEDEFGRMLTESGHRLRKSVRILERWGQPADHPTLSVAPEGRYLKTWLVSLGD